MTWKTRNKKPPRRADERIDYMKTQNGEMEIREYGGKKRPIPPRQPSTPPPSPSPQETHTP